MRIAAATARSASLTGSSSVAIDAAVSRSASSATPVASAVRETFLRAYSEAMEGSGLFASFDDVHGLLELAELEKLLYEVRYEATNRPDWLHIPLSGLKARLA